MFRLFIQSLKAAVTSIDKHYYYTVLGRPQPAFPITTCISDGSIMCAYETCGTKSINCGTSRTNSIAANVANTDVVVLVRHGACHGHLGICIWILLWRTVCITISAAKSFFDAPK